MYRSSIKVWVVACSGIHMAMAPWDELVYFATPVYTVFDSTHSAAVPIADANPNRVGLIIRKTNQGGPSPVSLNASPSNANGISVSDNLGIELNIRDHQSLVQRPWFASITVGNSLAVIEILLNKWPEATANASL